MTSSTTTSQPSGADSAADSAADSTTDPATESAAGSGSAIDQQQAAPARITPRSFYRFVAIAEAITWTLLIAGMALKYGADIPVAVLIGGSIHGLVFITYALTAGLVGVNQHWSKELITLAVVTAIVPYATIPFDRHLERRGLLDGDWRRTATDDPRDRTRLSRALRYFLARPVILTSVFVVAIAVIMTTMLIIGPPGGWK